MEKAKQTTRKAGRPSLAGLAMSQEDLRLQIATLAAGYQDLAQRVRQLEDWKLRQCSSKPGTQNT